MTGHITDLKTTMVYSRIKARGTETAQSRRYDITRQAKACYMTKVILYDWHNIPN